jgi:hypothetical protein
MSFASIDERAPVGCQIGSHLTHPVFRESGSDQGSILQLSRVIQIRSGHRLLNAMAGVYAGAAEFIRASHVEVAKLDFPLLCTARV